MESWFVFKTATCYCSNQLTTLRLPFSRNGLFRMTDHKADQRNVQTGTDLLELLNVPAGKEKTQCMNNHLSPSFLSANFFPVPQRRITEPKIFVIEAVLPLVCFIAHIDYNTEPYTRKEAGKPINTIGPVTRKVWRNMALVKPTFPFGKAFPVKHKRAPTLLYE